MTRVLSLVRLHRVCIRRACEAGFVLSLPILRLCCERTASVGPLISTLFLTLGRSVYLPASRARTERFA
ncbi:hypothetical protein NDU88_004173 [Pleurodeles waltl]|uniref:Uncharacterized protein n=1 Tax=Pleurodeles waltl TaxID=8319 RepID=A0AAV7QEP9_PLEWA|nr:hypothetical protein NDU88_004173 [Pleurodeles waltl]